MTSTEAHTPLEMLILFQTLHSPTADPPLFTRISESMKNNILIKESESFESTRLEPDSLKDLYLRIMREEIRSETNGSSKVGNEKDEQPNPRKRKLSSPLLQTVDEAAQHAHLLPPLLNRLYFRYRDHTIRAIEDEERKYRLLQRDIQEINRGEWDARLQHQELSSKRDLNGVASIKTLLHRDSEAEKPQSDDIRPVPRSSQQQPVEVLAPVAQLPNPPQLEQEKQHKTVSKPHSDSSKQTDPSRIEKDLRSQAQSTVASPQESETIAPPSSSTAEPLQISAAPDASSRPQPISSDSSVPFLPPRQHANPSYPLASPKLDINNRRLPYPPNQSTPGTAPSVSPRLNQPALASQDRSSQSPIILPPPSAMLRSSGSPTGPLDTLADMAGQQFRPNTALQSPRPVQTPGGQPPIQLPQPRNYPHPVYPYYDTQPAYGVAYQPYGPNPITPYHHPSQGAGPVYQGAAPSPSRGQIYSNIPHYHPPSPSYSQYPAYPQQPPYYPPPVQTQPNRAQVPRFSDQRTPISHSNRNHPSRLTPINTSVSSTRWKDVEDPESIRSPRSPTRPGPEDISPISEKAPSPIPETLNRQSSTPRNPRGRKARGSSMRGNRSRGRGARAVSAASSTVAGSAQSHGENLSTEGLDDELSIDNHNPLPNSKIKPEPPATPAGDEDVSITETTADEGSRKSTRRRRGTLRSLEMTESNRKSTKRKRDEPEENLPPLPSPSFPINRTNHILASRNFPRTSATIMNDISAHKLASMFAKPLTEREAPGYKDLIYRPQDLKSIKSAIIAGGKALVSVTDNSNFDGVGSPAQAGVGTPSGKNAISNWIAATPDVVPPKGIVNSAQLEKELMRMFANAIMFNPDSKRGVGPAFRPRKPRRHVVPHNTTADEDEDAEGDADEPSGREDDEEDGGVVTDTREMFEAVERSVGHWRAAERGVENVGSVGGRARLVEKEEDQDVDELAGEDELEEGGAGRRRRR